MGRMRRADIVRSHENSKRAEAVREHAFMKKARTYASERKVSLAKAIGVMEALEPALHDDFKAAQVQLSPAVRRRQAIEQKNGGR